MESNNQIIVSSELNLLNIKGKTIINLENIINSTKNNNKNNKIIKKILEIFVNEGIVNIELDLDDFIRITNGFNYFFRNINLIEIIGIDNYINNTLEIFNLKKIIGENNYKKIAGKNINIFNIINNGSNRFEEVLNNNPNNPNNPNNLKRGGIKFNTRYIIFLVFGVLAALSGISYLNENNVRPNNSLIIKRKTLNSYQQNLKLLNTRIYKAELENRPGIEALISEKRKTENLIQKVKNNLGENYENKSNILDIIYLYLKEYYDEALLLIIGLLIDCQKGENFYKSLSKRLIFVSPNKIRKNILFLSITEFIGNYEVESELDKCKKELEKCKEELEKCKTLKKTNKQIINQLKLKRN